MPAPIVPAPTTPTRWISAMSLTYLTVAPFTFHVPAKTRRNPDSRSGPEDGPDVPGEEQEAEAHQVEGHEDPGRRPEGPLAPDPMLPVPAGEAVQGHEQTGVVQ